MDSLFPSHPDVDVSGYPTVKYFTAEGPNDYSGGRDLDSLKKFVSDELEVKCDVNNADGCSDKEKGFIEAVKVLPNTRPASHCLVLVLAFAVVLLIHQHLSSGLLLPNVEC